MNETRNLEELHQHYTIEKKLAEQLRCAPRRERLKLYPALYQELYRLVPKHPQLTRKKSPEETEHEVQSQFKFVRNYVRRDCTFLELGAGDCALALEVARHARRVIAVEVSEEISRQKAAPANFELLLSDGCSINLPNESVDLAYSNQLMEHLHPEDALFQLREVCRVLKPGGQYVCLTPNRLNGPHDISMYFDTVATGFHLKEYTTSELARLFREAGFRQVRALFGVKGHFSEWPVFVLSAFERVFATLPHRIRQAVGRRPPCSLFLEVRLVGTR